MVKYQILFSLTFLFVLSVKAQNSNDDYQLLKYSKGFPERYFKKLDETATKLVSEQTILDEKDAHKIYTNALTGVKKLFELGYIIHEGEIYEYINELFREIYKDEPEVVEKVHLYVTKFSSLNAFTTPDGTILINLGLLSVLENREELAFIIAHETGHYLKSHALKSKKESDQLEEKSYDTEDEKILYLKLSYNREFESESDAYAINKLTSISGFDVNKSTDALSKLEFQNTDLKDVSQDFYELIISTEFIPDSSDIFVDHEFESFENEEIKSKSSVFRGDVDNYSTHPAIDKRMVAIKEILKYSDYEVNENAESSESEVNEFHYIQKASFFETANHAFESGKFILAFAYASYLIDKYPDSEYVLNLLNKSLYWISYYKEINDLDNEADETPVFFRSRYWLAAKYFKEISSADMKKLAFFTAKKYQKKMEDNDTYNFYLALQAENFLGKEAASVFMSKYKKNFPDGKYINLINRKLSDS